MLVCEQLEMKVSRLGILMHCYQKLWQSFIWYFPHHSQKGLTKKSHRTQSPLGKPKDFLDVQKEMH